MQSYAWHIRPRLSSKSLELHSMEDWKWTNIPHPCFLVPMIVSTGRP